jgi:hypothetical protein
MLADLAVFGLIAAWGSLLLGLVWLCQRLGR